MPGLQLAVCINISLQEEKQFLLQKRGFELIAYEHGYTEAIL